MAHGKVRVEKLDGPGRTGGGGFK